MRLVDLAPLTRVLAGVRSTDDVVTAMTRILPTLGPVRRSAWWVPVHADWVGRAHSQADWTTGGPRLAAAAFPFAGHTGAVARFAPPQAFAGETWTAAVPVVERRQIGRDHVYGVLLLDGDLAGPETPAALEAIGAVLAIALATAETLAQQRLARQRGVRRARLLAEIRQSAARSQIQRIGAAARPGLTLLEHQIANEVAADVLAHTIASVSREIRDVILALDAERPYVFDLAARLKRLTRAQDTGPQVSLEVVDPGGALGRLASTLGEDLYLWFTEALDNARRHAQATRIEVGIGVFADRLIVGSVRDDGIGLDLAEMQTQWMRRGLSYLAALIEQHGGLYALQGAPGDGLEVVFRVPVLYGSS